MRMRSVIGLVWDMVVRAVRRIDAHNSQICAGHIAYTAILAFFPFISFLASAASFAGTPEAAQTFLSALYEHLPKEVEAAVKPLIDELLAKPRGGVMTVSFLAAMWLSSAGVEALRTGVNLAYGTSGIRSVLYTRAHALFIVLAGSLAIIAASASIVLGPVVWELLVDIAGYSESLHWVWNSARYGLAIALLFGTVCILYRWLPNKRQKWRDIFGGAVLATSAWLALGTVFSIYLTEIGQFSAFYGSIAGIVISLVFVYLTGFIFLLGAEFNAVRRDRRDRRSA